VEDDLTRRTEAVNGHPSAGIGQHNPTVVPEDVATLDGDGATPPVDGARPFGSGAHVGDAAVPAAQTASAPSEEELREAHRAARRRFLNGVRELAETVILALIFFFALRAVVQNFRVEGSSMVPSFLDGQYVLVNKAVYTHVSPGTLPGWVPILGGGTTSDRYLFHQPQRGDVIVFHPPPPNDPSRDFIKRVVGVPGDTVDIRDGGVYVNGARIAEPFIQQPTFPINVRFSHVALGPNQYYVLGDNRGNSSDSRAWGPVTGDAIVGRAWLVYWPLSAVKVAPNHAEQAPAPQQVPPPPVAAPAAP
jgi:signal peptidase I